MPKLRVESIVPPAPPDALGEKNIFAARSRFETAAGNAGQSRGTTERDRVNLGEQIILEGLAVGNKPSKNRPQCPLTARGSLFF
jgi:hypothetical protein